LKTVTKEMRETESIYKLQSMVDKNHLQQLSARGTKERARLGWPFFGREIFILNTMMFREVDTVLIEREHFKMIIRSVLDYVRLIFSRTE
jgi:hypothetical protein